MAAVIGPLPRSVTRRVPWTWQTWRVPCVHPSGCTGAWFWLNVILHPRRVIRPRCSHGPSRQAVKVVVTQKKKIAFKWVANKAGLHTCLVQVWSVLHNKIWVKPTYQKGRCIMENPTLFLCSSLNTWRAIQLVSIVLHTSEYLLRQTYTDPQYLHVSDSCDDWGLITERKITRIGIMRAEKDLWAECRRGRNPECYRHI